MRRGKKKKEISVKRFKESLGSREGGKMGAKGVEYVERRTSESRFYEKRSE